MQSIINRFTMRMQAVAQGDAWYGMNAKEALDKIPAEIATKRFHGQHNIAEILKHMIQWKRFCYEKAVGNVDFDIYGSSEHDWETMDSITIKEWSGLKAKYFTINEDLIDAILNMEKEWLDQSVPGRKYTYSFLYNGIIEHDIYHLGQIIFIYKMTQA